MLQLLREFVAFDLETTGLDSDKDQIIEFGAVKVRDGRIEETFSQLVRCESALTPLVQSLTGLTNEMLCEGRDLADALDGFTAFCGDLPLIAHNSDFDTTFLRLAARQLERPSLANPVYDSLYLSRIAWPTMANHRLETLATTFDVRIETTHRAVPDAEKAARIFLLAQERLSGYSPQTLSNMSHLLAGIETPWSRFFGAPELPPSVVYRPVPAASPLGPGKLVREALDRREVDALFQPDGSLSKLLPDYEARKSQQTMAGLTAKAINLGEVLVAEAETGTGKTLAYLLPAVLWAMKNNQRVLLSTATKSLQQQLLEKESALLAELFPDARIAMLKGRENYLCLGRFEQVLKEPSRWLQPEERLGVLPIISWLEGAETGDIQENSGFNHERNPVLWGKLHSDARSPIAKDSKLAEQCFYQRARRKAAQSHLIVVNHSLFLRDMQLDYSLLPSYEVVIFDEAHRLRDAGHNQLGREITFFKLRHLLQAVCPTPDAWSGVLGAVHEALREQGESLEELEALREAVFHCEKQLQRFFNKIARNAKKNRKDGDSKFRFTDRLLYAVNTDPQKVLDALDELLAGLQSLGGRLSHLDLSTGPGFRWEPLSRELATAQGALGDFRRDFSHVCNVEAEGEVYWMEDYLNPHRIRLRSSPIDLGSIFRERMYDILQTVVFTSATMSVNHQLQYFTRRMGIDELDRGRVQTKVLKSPFEWKTQRRILLPRFAPSPNQKDTLDKLNGQLFDCLRRVETRSLLLFTSVHALKTCRAQLGARMAAIGRKVFAQHVDGGRENVLHLFRHNENACLLGTDSFWEGLDLPGKSLELLVITKLPFPVPSDPMVQAQSEKLQAEGKNPFYEYFVPEAVLKLRQGMGRLIRHSQDRGVIWIFDPRLLRERYAKAFFRSWDQDGRETATPQDLVRETLEGLGMAPPSAMSEAVSSERASEIESAPHTPMAAGEPPTERGE